MRRSIIASFAVLCAALAVGCAPDFEEGDEHFYVNHEGISMPVWVTGNWRSDRIVVHVHGGPGTTNAIYYQKSSYQRLAEDVGIAYYEQRGAGSTHGNHRGELSVDQMVEDLDVVMDVLEHRYPDAEFVLMGHSWGGHLGTAYLLDPERQARFNGWIEQDGAHDASCDSQQWVANWTVARADEELAKDLSRRDRKRWEEVKDFYANVYRCDPETEEHNLYDDYGRITVEEQHSLNVRAAGGYDVDPDRVLTGAETAELVFQSQFDLTAVLAHSPLPNMKGYYGTDLTPRMGEITIPSLVLWGEHDIITPYVEAQPGYEALGAPPDQKRLVMFADSGHNPWAEEPEKFYDVVAEFVDEVLPPR